MANPAKTERTPWREIDGRAVIIQTKAGEVHELNATATFLWRQTDGSRTVAELAEALRAEFEIDEATALADVNAFLGELAAKGLLRVQTSQ